MLGCKRTCFAKLLQVLWLGCSIQCLDSLASPKVCARLRLPLGASRSWIHLHYQRSNLIPEPSSGKSQDCMPTRYMMLILHGFHAFAIPQRTDNSTTCITPLPKCCCTDNTPPVFSKTFFGRGPGALCVYMYMLAGVTTTVSIKRP